MSWTDPPTWVSGAALTAAQLNQQLRNNFQELMPAQATVAGQFFLSAGPNSLRSRMVDSGVDLGTKTVTSTSYDDGPVGPEVTVQTGKMALALWAYNGGNNTFNNSAVYGTVQVTGATEIDLGDAGAGIYDGGDAGDTYRQLQVHLFAGDTELVPGENTFSMKYRVREGNGDFSRRELIILPF